MAESSFYSSFAFADLEAERKYYEEIEKAIKNPPKREHSKLKYSKEREEEVIKKLLFKLKH